MTKDAFSDAVRKSEKKLYISALSVVANTEDAADAVANAIAYAWEHLDQLRDESKFDAWLLRVTYSEAKTIRRKNRRYADIDELADAFYYETDHSDIEFFDILTRARLDEKTNRIFMLYFLSSS